MDGHDTHERAVVLSANVDAVVQVAPARGSVGHVSRCDEPDPFSCRRGPGAALTDTRRRPPGPGSIAGTFTGPPASGTVHLNCSEKKEKKKERAERPRG